MHPTQKRYRTKIAVRRRYVTRTLSWNACTPSLLYKKRRQNTEVRTYLEQLLENGTKMLVNSLLRLSNQGSPDVGHGIPDSRVGIILVPVQLGD